jgi:hypothetical protein
MEEHIDAIAGVREAHVETLGQGDALIVIDAEDELINEIDETCWTTWRPAAQPRACSERAFDMVRAASRSETARWLRLGLPPSAILKGSLRLEGKTVAVLPRNSSLAMSNQKALILPSRAMSIASLKTTRLSQ